MRFLLKALVAVAPVLLAACGGGGGSAGEAHFPYSIQLSADKTVLPVNLTGASPGIGAGAPYTTAIYVKAKEGSSSIPDGTTNVFACGINGGISSGSLYYLDGDPAHEIDQPDGNGGTVKIPKAYSSITLGSNSGGALFYFHAGNQSGTAQITCSVQDPRESQPISTSISINVTGNSASVPATIVYSAQEPLFLGTSTNLANLQNNVTIAASVTNDAKQPIGNNGKPNVQLNILPVSAFAGAKLLANNQTATSMQVNTLGGVAQFSLSSGPNPGVVVVEMIADRADNDVSNGIQQPVRALTAIPVVKAVTASPAIPTQALTAINGQPYTYYLQAQGGLPPYRWYTTSPLPQGLSLSADGVISGTPSLAVPGTYMIQLQLVDANGAPAVNTITLTVTGNLPDTPVAFAIAGCANNDINQACVLPEANVGESYAYAFTVTNGTNVKWSIAGLPSWLSLNSNTDSGVISSGGLVDCTAMASFADPAHLDAYTSKYSFNVTASNGTNSVTRAASITVKDTAGLCTKAPPANNNSGSGSGSGGSGGSGSGSTHAGP